MRSEEHIPGSRGRSEAGISFALPPGSNRSQPFCLQPGHKDSVAAKVRPDFQKRTRRGGEAHASKYFIMAPMVWMPGAILGSFVGVIGNLVGGEPGAIGCVIAGAVAFPGLMMYAGIAARRESRRREEVYATGQLLLGRVIACVATEEYYPGNSEALPERTGAYVVTLSYRFQTPTGRYLRSIERATHRDIPQPLPDKGTPVVILYLDDDRYEAL